MNASPQSSKKAQSPANTWVQSNKTYVAFLTLQKYDDNGVDTIFQVFYRENKAKYFKSIVYNVWLYLVSIYVYCTVYVL